jgi:hypothetical protein
MGCCVSTEKTPALTSVSQKHDHSLIPSRSDAIESRAPPPSAEEESVKEVLSETPKPKPIPQQKHELYDQPTKPIFDKTNNDDNKIEYEVSEVCSVSESVSTTTTTTTKRDEDEEVRQRVFNKSPLKKQLRNRGSYTGSAPPDFVPKRERVSIGKSPTRRSDMSPGRFNSGPTRLVQGREPVARRGLKAESGEASARRSRSPATRIDNGANSNRSMMGRSPSAKRTNRSPGRVRTVPTEANTRKIEQANNNAEEEKWPTTNESLENPLVSLECFIFL